MATERLTQTRLEQHELTLAKLQITQDATTSQRKDSLALIRPHNYLFNGRESTRRTSNAIHEPIRRTSNVTHQQTSSQSTRRTSNVTHQQTSSQSTRRTSNLTHQQTSSEPIRRTSNVTHQQTSSEPTRRTSNVTHQQTSSEPTRRTSNVTHQQTSSQSTRRTSNVTHQQTSSEPTRRTSNVTHQLTSSQSERKSSRSLPSTSSHQSAALSVFRVIQAARNWKRLSRRHQTTQEKPKPRLENTYRLGPDPQKLFSRVKVEVVIEDVFNRLLKNFKYSSSDSKDRCLLISAEILRLVKHLDFQRYKIVCNVIIMQNKGQGSEVARRCVWDSEMDSSASVTRAIGDIVFVANVHAVYFE